MRQPGIARSNEDARSSHECSCGNTERIRAGAHLCGCAHGGGQLIRRRARRNHRGRAPRAVLLQHDAHARVERALHARVRPCRSGICSPPPLCWLLRVAQCLCRRHAAGLQHHTCHVSVRLHPMAVSATPLRPLNIQCRPPLPLFVSMAACRPMHRLPATARPCIPGDRAPLAGTSLQRRRRPHTTELCCPSSCHACRLR